MPLTSLNLWGCDKVQDLTLLKDMPLKILQIGRTGVTDLSPLRDMPLEAVYLTPRNITRGMDVLREMKGVRSIGFSEETALPVAIFWMRYDNREFE
jgi:hypothetical protein